MGLYIVKIHHFTGLYAQEAIQYHKWLICPTAYITCDLIDYIVQAIKK